MANSYTTIKDLIRFLDDVNRGEQIERKEFDFFILTNDLDNILDSLKTQIIIEFKAKKRVTISDYSCSSGNWTRTSDLRVMSPTSYLV